MARYYKRPVMESRRVVRTGRRLSELTGSADEFQVFRYNNSTKSWNPVDAKGGSGDPKVYDTKEDAQKSAAYKNLKDKGIKVKVAAADWNGKDEARVRIARRMSERNQRLRRRAIRESQYGAGDTINLTYTAYANWRNNVFSEGDFNAVFDDYIVYDRSYNEIQRALSSIGSAPGDDELANYIDEKYYPNAASAVQDIFMEFDTDNEKLLVTVKLNTTATDEIVEEVIDYVNGQMSDGWGEGFEQNPVFETRIYAVYNMDDIELYADEREAERALRDHERDAESYYDDEEDEDDYYDRDDEYTMDAVDIELCYSFWKRGMKTPEKVEVV